MATESDVCDIAVCSMPKFSDLVAVRMKIGPQLLEEYYSYYTAVTVILRDLAVNNMEILAGPGWQDDDFFMIMSEKRWKETGWRGCLIHANLAIMEDRMKVTAELFASCVWYTIMCRMAPEWNRIGHLFVQGCDFLTNANCRNYQAIEMKVNYARPGRLQLTLIPNSIAFSQLTKKYFNGELSAMNVFSGTQNRAVFNTRGHCLPSCYVLPRLTKGSILSLSKSLPATSIFEDYTELQNYWKGMYGYSLPRGEPEFYCEVMFCGPSRTMFTYPNFCLLSKSLETLKSTEREYAQTVKAFTTDLYAKVAVLCEIPLKLMVQPRPVVGGFHS